MSTEKRPDESNQESDTDRKEKDGFFAKIPTIYLELHRFNFSHGTYQSPSQFFLGRDEIRNRLRAMFTHSSSNSGTYLITGDRGVGKTSLVNKVLEELSPKYKFPKGLKRFSILLFCCFIINIILYEGYFNHISALWGGIILGIIFFLATLYLGYFSLLTKRRHSSFMQIINGLIEYTYWGRDSLWSNNLFNIIRGIGVTSCILTVRLCLINFHYGNKIYQNPMFLCILFGGFLCILSAIRYTNCILYRSNKKINKDYKKSISNNKTLSLLISSTIILSLVDIVCLILKYSINNLFIDTAVKSLFFIIVGTLLSCYLVIFTKEISYSKKTEKGTKEKKKRNTIIKRVRMIAIISTVIYLTFNFNFIEALLTEIINISVLTILAICIIIAAIVTIIAVVTIPIAAIAVTAVITAIVTIPTIVIIPTIAVIAAIFILALFISPIKVAIKNTVISYKNKLNDSKESFIKAIESLIQRLYVYKVNFKKVYEIYKETIICLKKAHEVNKEFIKRHYFFKHIFNTPTQISVKINLGYEELKSIDVLRLISHNINIEYKKYLYSSSFYYWRTFVVIISCSIITIFFNNCGFFNIIPNFSKLVFLQKYINYLKQIYRYIEQVYDWILQGIWNLFYYSCKTISINNDLNWESNPILEYLPLKQVIFFFLMVMLYKSTAYIPFLSFLRAPYCNLRKLNELQESIAASIKKEEKVSIGNFKKSFLGFRGATEKNYPMSDAHDIEKRLIDIIDSISRHWLFQSPQFIIVFDELDKIESSGDEKERIVKTDSFSPDTIRNRQEAVFKLLSSLKYILTTMQAKFVFVAGREIYEASLADAADRSHYLSSIFNDVINVPSFMSDFSDDKSRDICSMTEQYVCKQLLPDDIIVDEFSLNTYNEYLKRNDLNSKDDTTLSDLERQKIMFTLHNFIVYLTYTSKGAPKKMINLFENYVKRMQPYDFKLSMREYREKSILPITRKYYKNTIYFLKFDFYEQYSINVMSRMVKPIIYRFNRSNIHQYGDKLIVSTLFVLDHLYKFHRYSFSWRALESSPELIDVDKTPELRDHITDLLHFLSQNDMKMIGNGLYDFRFFKKISQEICFLTRVSEHASAIFNFTLDESLAVKQFYRRNLITLREQYNADKISVENSIDGLASIHFALGELSLYDEEIGEAIIEFDSALSILETLEPKAMTSEQIVVLIKIMLSLGIAYEKQNLNDRALLIYSEAVRILVASRNTDISSFGLSSEEGEDRRMIILKNRFPWGNKEPGVYFRNCEDRKPLMQILDELPHIHPNIHEIISKITVYESLRLLYLPLLAKFQMLEKAQIGGIQKTDIRRLLKEFYFLANMLNKDNRNMMCATFYLKVGDILYYKNSHFFKDINDFKAIFPFNPFKDDSSTNTNTDILEQSHTDALFFYKHSLMLLLSGLNYTNSMSPQSLLNQINDLNKNNFEGWDDTKFNLMATILTNIGDTLLSTLEIKEERSTLFLKFLYYYINDREQGNRQNEALLKEISFIQDKLSNISMFYILASWFYKKGTDYNMASFQCLRILSLIRYHYIYSDYYTDSCIQTNKDIDYSISLHLNHQNNEDININKIAEFFVNKSIDNCRKAFKDMHFENNQDIYTITQETEKKEGKKYLNCSHMIYDETFESIIAYKDIIFKKLLSKIENSTKDEKIKQIKDFYKFFNTIRYENVSNIYNRLKLLKFKSEVNYVWLRAYCELPINQIPSYASDSETQIQELQKAFYKDENILKDYDTQKLISDSIFNLMEILKFTKIYGETYLLTNLFVADASHKLMNWLQIEQSITNSDVKQKIKEQLVHLIGKDFQTSILEITHWANAQRYYYKVKEMHYEGRTYKDMINRTCFLTDEYSDQRFHFITARERRIANKENLKKILGNISSANGDNSCNISSICK